MEVSDGTKDRKSRYNTAYYCNPKKMNAQQIIINLPASVFGYSL